MLLTVASTPTLNNTVAIATGPTSASVTELLLLFPLLLLRSKIVCKLPSSSFKIFKDLGSTAREPSFPFATAFFKGASALSSENFCSNSSLNSATILPGLNEIRQNKRYQQLQELHLTLEMAWLHNFAQIRVTSHVTRHRTRSVSGFRRRSPFRFTWEGGGGVRLYVSYIEKTNVKISFINFKLPYLNAMICIPIKFLTAEYCLCIYKFK